MYIEKMYIHMGKSYIDNSSVLIEYLYNIYKLTQIDSNWELTRNCHVVTDPCYGKDPVVVAVLKKIVKVFKCKYSNINILFTHIAGP